MGLKGFIFDLDGVIVDTAKYHYQAWRNLARELGFDFSEEQNEQFKGVSRRRSLEILLEIGGVTASPAEFETWMERKNQEYLGYIQGMDASEVLPNVTFVLEHLQTVGAPIALGSASKNARPILDKVGLLDRFDAIVDGNDVTRAKPDPEVFLVAAERLGRPPERCVVFEDAVAGIQAANRAGMTSIGIGDAATLAEADTVFPDFRPIDLSFLNQLADSQ